MLKRFREKDPVKIRVTLPSPQEVMVSRFRKVNLEEEILRAEVLKQIGSSLIVLTDIEISSEIDWCSRICIGQLIDRDG